MPESIRCHDSIRLLLAPLVAWLGFTPAWLFAAVAPNPVGIELRERAVAAMQRGLHDGQRWEKVHSAEYLLLLDYSDGVRAVFDDQLQRHGSEPQYRIGIWRVLARASSLDKERAAWIGKIRDVAFSREAPDRLHAVETLAKLGVPLKDNEAATVRQGMASSDGSMASYCVWLLAGRSPKEAESRLIELLANRDPKTRLVAAYALRHCTTLSQQAIAALHLAAEHEPTDSPARAFLVAASAVHPKPGERDRWKKELLRLASHGDTTGRVEACQTLAQIAGSGDLTVLQPLLDATSLDVQAAAAYAILRVGRRVPHHLTGLDWAVIVAYAMVVLSIGWCQSRRVKTREEYLLGGRQMKPLMVGVSMFAALISTLSYLAWPGEVIKNGPMMVSGILAYPLIALVVGWGIIPFIMRLKVTSAYEILEFRLGPAVRTLGSLLFLALRLMWMSVIVYASTTKVLIPLLGLPPSLTPLVCLGLMLATVFYTTLGGLRGVVITDLLQSSVLTMAAIITIASITVSLGGVEAWWPSPWPAYWPEPQYSYDPDARVTMFGAILAMFTFYICTATSDQIAIQRYLSTKDAKGARTVLCISLLADGTVTLILATIGLGLIAYFRAYPHLLADTQTILGDTDKLFPHYVLIGLPQGLCGLVVAGLIACSMSALSAGITSTSSVITVDFIDRLAKNRPANPNPQGEIGQVQSVRYTAVCVGLIVVAMSLMVNMIQGNLLEICFKFVNSLSAPLAGLFFLALFVPWARGFGALIGAACGLAVVIAVSYWRELTGTPGISFIWAIPLGLIVEVGVGSLVSLLPLGRVRKPTGKSLSQI